jgi:hypothetical protein
LALEVGRKSSWAKLTIIAKHIDGEISADKCSKEDEVMEEEIVEDSDKEGGDELVLDSNYLGFKGLRSSMEIQVQMFVKSKS